MRNTLRLRFAATLAIAAVAVLSTSSAAFSAYRSRVPNGTVFTCGTCHTNANIGGEGWNDFGKDVLLQDPDVAPADLETANQNANYDLPSPEWNADLCDTDSDGDGQTNGEELGDPACSWVFGQAAPRTTDISNPGDAESTSENPEGVDGGGEGEGEGEAGEGEGEGEGEPPPGCASTAGASTKGAAPVGALIVALLLARRRTRR